MSSTTQEGPTPAAAAVPLRGQNIEAQVIKKLLLILCHADCQCRLTTDKWQSVISENDFTFGDSYGAHFEARSREIQISDG